MLEALPTEQRLGFLQRFPGRKDWAYALRDAQIPPADPDWRYWVIMAGRGWGKSHAISCAVHAAVRSGVGRIHLIAPTVSDYIDVNLASIMKTAGRDPRPRWISSRHKMEWPNGAVCVCFSGEEPESLRGPGCELCVIDEIARMAKQQEVFDQAGFGLRQGTKPRMLIATTPRPTNFMKKLIKMDSMHIATGSTYDNQANLSPDFLKKMRELEGTRLGRQELQGAMLLDPIDALFKDEWIIRNDVKEDDDLIEQVTVGVDPSGGADEVGIVVCALLRDGRYAVLADRSISGTPGQWGEAAVKAHDAFDADDVTIETNFGGQMCVETIRGAAARMHERGERPTNLIRIKEVTASRGKALRAEPVSLLYEKNRVLHRRGLDALEGEMMSFSRDWDRATDGSPNRLDAMIWGISRLNRILTNIAIA